MPKILLLALMSCNLALAKTLRLHPEGGESKKCYPQSCELDSLGVYRLSFEARALPGARGQCLCAGIEGVNVDLPIDTEWKPYRFFLSAPYGSTGKVQSKLAFRLWNFFGDAEVRAIRLEKIEALDAEVGGQPLGEAESIVGSEYRYATVWNGEGHNRDRSLVSGRRVSFNTNRLEFRQDSELVYCHRFAARHFLSAEITIRSFSRKTEDWIVEVSRDFAEWHPLETRAVMETGIVATVPGELFPAEKLYVRLRREKTGCVQFTGYVFTARVDGAPAYLQGRTVFAAPSESQSRPLAMVPELYRDDFGEMLPVSSEDLAIWRAPSGRTVGQRRPLPRAGASSLEVSAAANEAEAVQLVLSPSVPIEQVTVSVAADLQGPAGSRIASSAVEIPYVGYVPVTIPSDATTLPGLYPDPLLPQNSPRQLGAGTNYPYWVRVKVPKGTLPGIYRGEVVVSGRNQRDGAFNRVSLRVPLTVRVYGFELPDTMTCKTLFGVYGSSARYHGAKKPAEVRRVNENYLAAMDACHLSPYMGPGRWRVTWNGDEPVFDWREFDLRVKEVLGGKYHFNAFRLDGSSFAVGDVKKDDPRYGLRLKRLLQGIEIHFAQLGILDKAYVYSYDEPTPKDDPKVVQSFAKFKEYAPRLRRLLTTPCRDSLVGAPDIWCTVASDFDNATAKRCCKAGDEFWLYVCMQPLAPYATTFSDHPSLELRTWLWQAWQRNVKGVLIWATDYWNPRGVAQTPGTVLNPYANAMTWREGGGTYGNGDGRFFYPPRSVFAEPESLVSSLKPGPNFEPPVPTIRAEMLRDGIEDYEYLAMLRRRDPNSPLLAVPDAVSRSFTEFSTDPQFLLEHRERLARALEGGWAWRMPFVVSNQTDKVFSALGELRAPEVLRGASNARWQVFVGDRAVKSCRYGDHLLFPCQIPARGVVSGWVCVREGSAAEATATEAVQRVPFLDSPLNLAREPAAGNGTGWRTYGTEHPKKWHGFSRDIKLKPSTHYFIGGFLSGTNLAKRAALYLHIWNDLGKERCSDSTSRSPERAFPFTPVFGFFTTRTNDVSARVDAAVLGNGTVAVRDCLIAECAIATPGVLEVAPPAASSPLLAVRPITTLRKVFPESPVVDTLRPLTLSLARGETESLQLALRAAKPLSRLEVRVSELTGPNGAKLPVEIGHVRYVPVERGVPNRLPSDDIGSDGWLGWWPDPIVQEKSFAMDPLRTESIRLAVTTLSETPAGNYCGEISFWTDGKELRRDELKVKVWNFSLPKDPEISAVFDLRGKTVRDRKALMDLMREKKVCPDHISPKNVPVKRGEDGRVTIDFSEYDRGAEEYFGRYGFTMSYTPECFYGSGWGNPPKKFLGEAPYEGEWPYEDSDWTTLRPAYKAAFQEALRLYWNHMKEKGWADRIVFYLSDEPAMFGPSKYVAKISAKIVALCRMIREVDPDIPVYASTWNHTTAWNGELNHWGIAAYGAFPPEEIPRRLAAGDRLWFTIDTQMCINTQFTATERLYGNFCFAWGATGFEYWGINWYTNDPWEKGWHRAILANEHPGQKDRWRTYPSGDGYLVYPPKSGVSEKWCSSIRLEAIRDGVEDYSYLKSLKRLAAQDGSRGERAARLIEEHRAFCPIPNAGGLYSSKILPDPERLERFRECVGELLSE